MAGIAAPEARGRIHDRAAVIGIKMLVLRARDDARRLLERRSAVKGIQKRFEVVRLGKGL